MQNNDVENIPPAVEDGQRLSGAARARRGGASSAGVRHGRLAHPQLVGRHDQLGCGLAAGLWLNWVALTGLGAWFGAVVEDPTRLGFDFAFVAVFVALLRGMWQGGATLLPWAASGAVAAAVYVAVPGPWYVAAGALAGLAAAVLTARPEESAA